MDDTARWNSRGRYFFDAIKSDPAAIERYLRALAAIGSDSAEIYLRSISYREPTLARALADELGFNLPENAALKSRIIDEDPAAACDQWLAELRKNAIPTRR